MNRSADLDAIIEYYERVSPDFALVQVFQLFKIAPDPEVKSKFKELEYLEQSVGTTGLLAIAPFLHTNSRDLWQFNMLEKA